MRVFIAVKITKEVRHSLAIAIKFLENDQFADVKIVNSCALHLTLKFLGEVACDSLQAIIRAMFQVVPRHRQFELRLNSIGAFPKSYNPRVLCVGLDGDLTALNELYRHLEQVLEVKGFRRAEREFEPHITLARIKRNVSLDVGMAVKKALSGIHSEYAGIRFCVDTVSLIQSIKCSDGVKYMRLATVSLKGND